MDEKMKHSSNYWRGRADGLVSAAGPVQLALKDFPEAQEVMQEYFGSVTQSENYKMASRGIPPAWVDA